MNEELKPCPLCGLAVATVTTCANLEECENFETCEDSGFHIVVCDVNKGGCGASSGYRKTYDAAVKAWNRRATDKPLDIKALENQQILEKALGKMAIIALSSQGMVISQESIKEMCDASKQRAAYFINGIGGYHHE